MIGIDESGRGSLFGPVFVAGVIFKDNVDSEKWYSKLNDSKKLNSKKRKDLVPYIKSNSHFYISNISNIVIDEINILNATFKGMNECISNLKQFCNDVYIDGNRFQPSQDNMDVNFKCIVKGDSKYQCIMAASILAKEAHDDFLNNIISCEEKYDLYDIKNNMGYGTKKHRNALFQYGYSDLHRKSFVIKSKQLLLEND